VIAESFSQSSSGLYIHTAAKLVFVRIFRRSKHVYSHTLLGWTVWIILCFSGAAASAILAIAVPIFSYLIGITASLFAAWYTYGLAGFFWLHDVFHLKGGMDGIKRRPIGATLAVLTILAGAFISVSGTYVSIKVSVLLFTSGIHLMYDSLSSKLMQMVQLGNPSFARKKWNNFISTALLRFATRNRRNNLNRLVRNHTRFLVPRLPPSLPSDLAVLKIVHDGDMYQKLGVSIL